MHPEKNQEHGIALSQHKNIAEHHCAWFLRSDMPRLCLEIVTLLNNIRDRAIT